MVILGILFNNIFVKVAYKHAAAWFTNIPKPHKPYIKYAGNIMLVTCLQVDLAGFRLCDDTLLYNIIQLELAYFSSIVRTVITIVNFATINVRAVYRYRRLQAR